MSEYGAVKGWKNRIRIGVSSALNESIWKAGRDPLLNSFTTETSVDIDKISVIGSRLPVSIVEGVKDVTGSLERNLYSRNTTYNEFIYVNDTTHYDLLKATGLGGTEGLECKILWNPVSNDPDDPYKHIIANVKFHNYRVAHSARDVVAESVDYDGSQLGLPGKKKLTIMGTNVALSDYQLKIELPLSGFDINRKVFGPDDICFTDKNGSIISHWVESWQTEKGVVWCKVPSIPAGTSTYIWMIYGDPFTTSLSNVSETFIRVIPDVQGSWQFDESGGTIAHDSSGNGNDGTIYGASRVDGKFENGLSFNGDSDYVLVPDDESLDISDEITVAAWFKTDTVHDGSIVWKDYSTYNPVYGIAYFGQSYGQISGRITDSGGSTHSLAFNFTADGDWHLIVLRYDGAYQKLFLDGVEKASEFWSGNIATSAYDLMIGSRVLVPIYFDGVIDNVQIYDRALSLSEISDLYDYRGYTTRYYSNRCLICKYVFPEPTVTA